MHSQLRYQKWDEHLFENPNSEFGLVDVPLRHTHTYRNIQTASWWAVLVPVFPGNIEDNDPETLNMPW